MSSCWKKEHNKKRKIILVTHTFSISLYTLLCLPDGPSPSHSPDLEAASSQGVRDSKENKEPSPKMRRRRSVKISSIALEPAQWQNDALHILTSAHDYRSMNDFLMKKVQGQTYTCTHIGYTYFQTHYLCMVPLKASLFIQYTVFMS